MKKTEEPVVFTEQVRDAFVTAYRTTGIPRKKLESMFYDWLNYVVAHPDSYRSNEL